MKNYTFSKVILLFAFISSFNFAQAQKPASNFKLQVGNKLIYTVDQGLERYNFIMTIKTLAPTVTFDWKMTAPVNKNGTIIMNKNAMDSAITMFNYFNGGTTKLTKQTSAFLSRNLYKQLQDGSEKIKFSVTENEDEVEEFEKIEKPKTPPSGSIYFPYSKKVKGKKFLFDCFILENKDGSNGLRVWKNEQFPLIIYMQTNFKIYLSEIQ